MSKIEWNNISDDIITMAKDVADGNVNINLIREDYHQIFSTLIPHLKNITEVYHHSVVSTRAEYLRKLLQPT